MSLLKSIRDAFSGKPPVRLRDRDGFTSQAEAPQDARDMFASIDTTPQPNVDGLALGLAYRDGAGNTSRRMIRVKAIGTSEMGDYVHAFCELRQAERTFFIDNIEEVTDYRSGATHRDARAYFLPYVEIARWRDFAAGQDDDATPTQRVLSAVRDELKIILYVAYADGTFQVDEQDVISDVVAARARRLGKDVADNYDHQRIMRWARGLHPDYASFERAVQRVATRDDVDMARIWRICKKLVMADREISPREVDAMDSLFVAIRNAGINADLN